LVGNSLIRAELWPTESYHKKEKKKKKNRQRAEVVFFVAKIHYRLKTMQNKTKEKLAFI
jgi:hypothetical protein